MSAPLVCRALSVGYDGRSVLSDVSFEMVPGEVVALLGPNGAGKSTLLRALAGILPTSGGEVVLSGDSLRNLSPREIARRIAFVPQEEAWQFAFTVEEVVAMGRLPMSHGFFDTEEDRAAASAAMLEADCSSLRRRPITELSGGERQRVLIARALAQNTQLLFLDEPTSHLDPQFQVGIAELIRRLAEEGKSLLVAAHDLPIAGIMADRAMLVYGGRTTGLQPVDELLGSSLLEQAYGAEFERLRTSEDRLVVVPKASPRLDRT